MMNEISSAEMHHNMQDEMIDDMIRNISDCHQQVFDPYELESRRRAQIERSNEWIEKMSPVVKYKIQEYIRKQKAKKMQRRKFSLACGLNNRNKQEQMYSSQSTSMSRRRSKRKGESSSSRNRNHHQQHHHEHHHMSQMHSAPMLERNLSQPEMHDSRKTASISHRRKSAPAEKMDLRDLDDLE
ncbi:hypothetical protein CAEBREN_18707 [Caenorhabditis brenneri]|uniref:Uncharacterized protein n=1 Tax=Caenorhabditis brenneri TaxID=135651 RepID=G0P8A6_CAEBE|nr:hypothetical protein CAEBREN_18707 [Caenorhabditis brenneri]